MCFSVEVFKDLNEIVKTFNAKVDKSAFQKINDLSQKNPCLFRLPDDEGRIFPNTFAPVVVLRKSKFGEERVITPMRYRLRPHNAPKEVPSKYNLFNARLDSLESRKSWREIFGKNHCIFPFKKFYEWVEDNDGQKKLVSFYPKGRNIMWAPALFDYYKGPDGDFYSFALITTAPNPEVLSVGHDRSPLFLESTFIKDWLAVGKSSKKTFKQILKNQENVYFSHTFENLPKKEKTEGENSKQLNLFKE